MAEKNLFSLRGVAGVESPSLPPPGTEGDVLRVVSDAWTSSADRVTSSTVGYIATYTSTSQLGGIAGLVVPTPASEDVNKFLAATGVGTVGFLDNEAVSKVKVSTTGQVAVYDTDTTVSGVDRSLPTVPQSGETGYSWQATGAGTAQWLTHGLKVPVPTGEEDTYRLEAQNGVGIWVAPDSVATNGENAVVRAGDVIKTWAKNRFVTLNDRYYDLVVWREYVKSDGSTVSKVRYWNMNTSIDVEAVLTGTAALSKITLDVVSQGYRKVTPIASNAVDDHYFLVFDAPTTNANANTAVRLYKIDTETKTVNRVVEFGTSFQYGQTNAFRDYCNPVGVNLVADYCVFTFGDTLYIYDLDGTEIDSLQSATYFGTYSNAYQYRFWPQDLYTIVGAYRSGDYMYFIKIPITAGTRLFGTPVPFGNQGSWGSANAKNCIVLHFDQERHPNKLLYSYCTYSSTNTYYYFTIIDLDRADSSITAQGFEQLSVVTEQHGKFFIESDGTYNVVTRITGASGAMYKYTNPSVNTTFTFIQNATSRAASATGLIFHHSIENNISIILASNYVNISYDGVYGTFTELATPIVGAGGIYESGPVISYPNSPHPLDAFTNNGKGAFIGGYWEDDTSADSGATYIEFPDPTGYVLPNETNGYMATTEYGFEVITAVGAQQTSIQPENPEAELFAEEAAGNIYNASYSVAPTPPIIGTVVSGTSVYVWTETEIFHSLDTVNYAKVHDFTTTIVTCCPGPNNAIYVASYNPNNQTLYVHEVNATTSTERVAQFDDATYYEPIAVAWTGTILVVLVKNSSKTYWCLTADYAVSTVNTTNQLVEIHGNGSSTYGIVFNRDKIVQFTDLGTAETDFTAILPTTFFSRIFFDGTKVYVCGDFLGAGLIETYAPDTTQIERYATLGSTSIKTIDVSGTSVVCGADDGTFWLSDDNMATEPMARTLPAGGIDVSNMLFIRHVAIFQSPDPLRVAFISSPTQGGTTTATGYYSSSISMVKNVLEIIDFAGTYDLYMGIDERGFLFKSARTNYVKGWKFYEDPIDGNPDATFEQKQALVANEKVWSSNTRVYLASSNGDIGVSSDCKNFTSAAGSPGVVASGAFVGGFRDNACFYAGNDAKLYLSTDNWATNSTPITGYAGNCVIGTFVDRDIAYFGFNVSGAPDTVGKLKQSENWSTLNTIYTAPDNDKTISAMASDGPVTVIGFTDGEIVFSNDWGVSWYPPTNQPGGSTAIKHLSIDKSNLVYVTYDDQVRFNAITYLLNAQFSWETVNVNRTSDILEYYPGGTANILTSEAFPIMTAKTRET